MRARPDCIRPGALRGTPTAARRPRRGAPVGTRTVRSAFTLIELLVVIAILALLVSILLPSLVKAKEGARQLICATNQAGIAKAGHLYAMDNNDILPRDGKGGWMAFTPPHLSPYVNGPTFEWDDLNDQDVLYETFKNLDGFHCPSVKDPRYVLHYIVNSCDFQYHISEGGYKEGPGVRGHARLSKVPHPADTLFFVEVNMTWLPHDKFGGYNIWRPSDMPFEESGVPNLNGRMISPNDTRHDGATSSAYFDGHARTLQMTPNNFPLSALAPHE